MWEIKDYQKWKHDKFEESNSQSLPNGESSAFVDTLPMGSMVLFLLLFSYLIFFVSL